MSNPLEDIFIAQLGNLKGMQEVINKAVIEGRAKLSKEDNAKVDDLLKNHPWTKEHDEAKEKYKNTKYDL